jgi:hypothetical protein
LVRYSLDALPVQSGDILATALPGFPVFDLAGLIGSSGWGLWIAALGITLLLSPKGERGLKVVAFLASFVLFIGVCGFLDSRLLWPSRPTRRRK